MRIKNRKWNEISMKGGIKRIKLRKEGWVRSKPSFTPLVEIEPSRQHQTTTKERRDVDANFLDARASLLWTRLLYTHTHILHPLLFSSFLSRNDRNFD